MKGIAITAAILACTAIASADSRVVIESATDVSRCTPADRARNTATLRRTLAKLIASRPTANPAHIDATIVSLTVVPGPEVVVVSAQVRLALSDERGQILSVVTGTSKVETDARRYNARQLVRLHDDAVSAAVEGTFDKVDLAVARATPSPTWLGKFVGDLVAMSRN